MASLNLLTAAFASRIIAICSSLVPTYSVESNSDFLAAIADFTSTMLLTTFPSFTDTENLAKVLERSDVAFVVTAVIVVFVVFIIFFSYFS